MVDREDVWHLLENVRDPEIPVLNVVEMGIVRDARLEGETWIVTMTPTYSGCPAMDTIEKDITRALSDAGIKHQVETVLSPAWTTDWLTEEAHQKLRDTGIAPPVGKSLDKRSILGKDLTIACPRCKSSETEMISNFGTTACKALYRCKSCGDPFDYFKCI